MKRLLLGSPVLLMGCTIVAPQAGDVAATLETAAAVSTSVGGPHGAVIGLGLTTVAGFVKWYQHKMAAKDVIASTQMAKAALSPAAQKVLRDAYVDYTPEKVQKYVNKVKQSL